MSILSYCLALTGVISLFLLGAGTDPQALAVAAVVALSGGLFAVLTAG